MTERWNAPFCMCHPWQEQINHFPCSTEEKIQFINKNFNNTFSELTLVISQSGDSFVLSGGGRASRVIARASSAAAAPPHTTDKPPFGLTEGVKTQTSAGWHKLVSHWLSRQMLVHCVELCASLVAHYRNASFETSWDQEVSVILPALLELFECVLTYQGCLTNASRYNVFWHRDRLTSSITTTQNIYKVQTHFLVWCIGLWGAAPSCWWPIIQLLAFCWLWAGLPAVLSPEPAIRRPWNTDAQLQRPFLKLQGLFL